MVAYKPVIEEHEHWQMEIQTIPPPVCLKIKVFFSSTEKYLFILTKEQRTVIRDTKANCCLKS